jgi:GT2 family glycosyltransferase
MYAAINVGLLDAATAWVGYLNSDDLVYPDCCARLTRLGQQTQAHVVYGSADRIDPAGRFLYSFDPAPPSQLLPIMRWGVAGGINQPGSLFRSESLRELGGFDENYKYSSDFDLFVRAMTHSLRFARLGRPPIAAFRLSPSQLSRTCWKEMGAERRSIVNRLHSERRWTDGLAHYAWQLSNTVNYGVRWLRYYQLSGKLRLVRSMALPDSDSMM